MDRKNQNFGAITGTGDYVGGIAGANNENPAIIANCTNSGAVTGTGKYVGGITGYNGYTGDYGTAKIINSHNTESGSVSGNSLSEVSLVIIAIPMLMAELL